ncbi:pitrilysin family protein [Ferruginibacter sp.]|uniref:M16 family metallopeptidase n=1 Tax=Ferruginibacter sp. TaxID=1940288 RepID=UPI0019BCA8BB|nr:M16 family metallopeptidase [Ferruginibacter sp.]MBC7629534.1 insulinase family protein [Ferruginibacter sp.]
MQIIKQSLLLCFLFVGSTVFSQIVPHQWKEATSAGYTYKYVTNDPAKARFYTLKNGLTVILSTTNKDPRIQCYIATKAGSKTDPADHTGLAHYLEHMLFKGTDKFGSLDWIKEKPELDKIDALYEEYNHTTDTVKRKTIYHNIDSVSGKAATYAIANEYDKMMSSMGAQGTNAFTSFEQTVYTDDVPANATDKYLAVQAERFRNPQFRIFHTELEAVYEEKNRGLDNDGRKVFEKLFAGLFKNNNYGRQTTIGTIEHLKNPSLLEIRKYFNTYYVPNNMGVIMSGDFDADAMIKKIDAGFAYMQNKPLPAYRFDAEQPITAPITEEVVGPDAENITIGYRLPGNKSKDVLLADLVGQILTNGKAGLMDLNLVKKQKLLRASASAFTLIDYGVLFMQGTPTQGQTLEEVKALMLGEIANLKKGNFDDNLITSIINNQKKNKILASESYSSRASDLMDAFTSELDWKDQVAYTDQLSKLTKKDIIAFANKYFQENYLVIFKRKGDDKNIIKVDKPAITPVETNRDAQSTFVKAVNNMPATAVKPVFLDFTKDLQKSKIGPAEVLYVQNKDNSIFRLQYRFDMGTWNNKKLGLAAQYLQFLGTGKMSAEDITKAFYKIACSFSVGASAEFTTVNIEGLQENFTKAVTLFEGLLKNCVADETALTALKARIAKSRTDAKLNKGAIMSGLVAYARFGDKNPFNYTLSDAELTNAGSAELMDILHNLNSYSHKIIFYGPQVLVPLTAGLKQLHTIPTTFKPAPAKTNFVNAVQNKSQVLFADYNMVQSEIRWVRNTNTYNPADEPVIDIFNNYFGGGMGALVFQTIRESKALAYSTFAFYAKPDKKENPFYTLAYVGCQADKFNESIVAMNELLNDLPNVVENIKFAKAGIKKDIETGRITQDGIIFDYLTAQRMGLDYDIRKKTYAVVDKIGYEELKKFHTSYIAHKPYTYCVVASNKKVSDDDMKKYGEVKKLSLEEIFGY